MAFRKKSPQYDFFDELIAYQSTNETLKMIDEIVDWEVIRRILSHAYDKSGRGYPGFDPVILAKMLLLESLYDLSDIKVVEECTDRLSFRKFLALDFSEKVPDDTTLVRFRQRIEEHGLLDLMEKAIREMIENKGLTIRPGSIKMIDASLIEAATRPPKKERKGKNAKKDTELEQSPAGQTEVQKDAQTGAQIEVQKGMQENEQPEEPEQPMKRSWTDDEADFTVKNEKPHYGYKLHIARDMATGIITKYELTTASVHDTRVFEQLLDGTESAVLADKGYDSNERRRKLAEKGTVPLIMARVYKNTHGCWNSIAEYPRFGRLWRTVSRISSAGENADELSTSDSKKFGRK